MKTALALVVLAVASIGSSGAEASGGLYLTTDYHATGDYNSAAIRLVGDQNVLFMEQDADSFGGTILLNVDITGNLNGGPLGVTFSAPLMLTSLIPGQLVQTGHDNSITVTVAGSQNLLAASQFGSGNVLTAAIIGHNNQAAVLQSGNGNTVTFSQNGNGNSLTVIQRSY